MEIWQGSLPKIIPADSAGMTGFHKELQGHHKDLYMWTKNCEPISPEAMCKTILDYTTKYFDSPIRTQEYQQVCVEIGHVFLGSKNETREENLDALASQAGHSIIMTRLRYAPEVGMPPSMSSDLLGCFARVSEAW